MILAVVEGIGVELFCGPMIWYNYAQKLSLAFVVDCSTVYSIFVKTLTCQLWKVRVLNRIWI